MKRKGQILDLIIIPIILLALGIVLIFALNIVTTIRNAATTTDPTQQAILDSNIYMLKGMDTMGIFMFIILLLMVGGIAWMVRSSPIGLAIIIFLGLAVVLLGAIFSNLFYNVASDTNIVQTSNQFPLLVGLFNKLPLFIAIGIFVILIFLIGKPQVI